MLAGRPASPAGLGPARARSWCSVLHRAGGRRSARPGARRGRAIGAGSHTGMLLGAPSGPWGPRLCPGLRPELQSGPAARDSVARGARAGRLLTWRTFTTGSPPSGAALLTWCTFATGSPPSRTGAAHHLSLMLAWRTWSTARSPIRPDVCTRRTQAGPEATSAPRVRSPCVACVHLVGIAPGPSGNAPERAWHAGVQRPPASQGRTGHSSPAEAPARAKAPARLRTSARAETSPRTALPGEHRALRTCRSTSMPKPPARAKARRVSGPRRVRALGRGRHRGRATVAGRRPAIRRSGRAPPAPRPAPPRRCPPPGRPCRPRRAPRR